MNWIAWIILGAIAGFIAEKVTNNNMGLLMNIVVGLIGSVLGGWLFGMLNITAGGFVGSLVVATIGAILLLLIVGAVKKKA
ncbi:MAG: GlsB/YeaQ/YmgE family stress response membrane protein [Rubricoccaceae bacterium]|nr:GlsB/YeaQ/YmgE family stress response membrane protein [Rubricoccaceae bacterium]